MSSAIGWSGAELSTFDEAVTDWVTNVVENLPRPHCGILLPKRKPYCDARDEHEVTVLGT